MNQPATAPATTANRSRLATARRGLLIGLIVSACGCASSPLSQLRLPGMRATQAQQSLPSGRIAQRQAAPTHPAARQSATGSTSAAHANLAAVALPVTTDTSAAKTKPSINAASVRTVSHQEPVAETPGQTSFDPNCAPNSILCPSDPSDASCALPSDGCAPEYPPVPQYWNDQEYLYDGGDREPKVTLTDKWEVRGLDSQDTVAHYETIDGKLCISPSNRVPIYAPRFGAVRKTTAPTIAARAVGATPLIDPRGASIKSSNEPAGDVTSPVGPKKREVVKLIDGLHDRTRGVAAEKIMPAHDMSSYQMALNRLQNHTTALRREDLIALLGEYMVNARTWVSPEGISVAINGVLAAQTRDAKQVEDITLYDIEPGKCSLRICKAASHSAASPGDIIHFSIRFDNVGDKPIGNLVILDSLVTRLEYIDGSQQCVLSLASNKTPEKEGNPVKFSTAENEAGSTVLRWEADLPLEAGDSGVITFRCRVR